MGFVQTLLRGSALAHPWYMLFQNRLSQIIIVLMVLSFLSPYLSAGIRKLKKPLAEQLDEETPE